MGYKFHPFCWSTTSCSESPQQKKYVKRGGGRFRWQKSSHRARRLGTQSLAGFYEETFHLKWMMSGGLHNLVHPHFYGKKKNTHTFESFSSQNIYICIYIYIYQAKICLRSSPSTDLFLSGGITWSARSTKAAPAKRPRRSSASTCRSSTGLSMGLQWDFQWDLVRN